MRLVAKQDVYGRLASDAVNESEFEHLIAHSAPLLFPSHRLVGFKTTVTSEYGRSKADFALVHKGYREWWVVEVELAHHPFSAHVLPQVQCLSAADYGDAEAAYLSVADSKLDLASLREMMLGEQPRVLVIVNARRDDWVPSLAALRVHVLVIEVFRSTLDAYALVVHGALPELSPTLISVCTPQPALGKFLSVHSPAALSVRHGETIDIEWEGSLTRWNRVDVKDAVWLHPSVGGGLPPGNTFELHRSEAGGYFFQKATRHHTGGHS